MQIGDHVLRDLALRFTQIEGQFELLRWVDSHFGKADVQVDKYLTALAERLHTLVRARKSAVFTKMGGRWVDFDAGYNREHGELEVDEKHFDSITAENLAEDQTDKVSFREEITSGHCHVYVRIDPRDVPPLLIVLGDEFFGRKIAEFYDEGFRQLAQMIAERSGAVIDNQFELRQSSQTQRIMSQFLTPKALKNRPFSPDQLYDERWSTIVDLFVGYFPTWSPLAFSRPPLVQILTVNSLTADFIVLRTTRGKRSVAYQPLRRDLTISGLFLEYEAKNSGQEYLLVNPTDREYSQRYASILFDDIPQSELVIPVRDGDDGENNIVGLINLEHPDRDAFSDYHLDIALRAARAVAPFILYLISEEKQNISADKQFRYVVARLLGRISRLHLHRIKNLNMTIGSAIQELQIGLGSTLKNEQARNLRDLVLGFDELKKASRTFVANLSGHMSYGEIDLADSVMAAINEFDVERIAKDENIAIKHDLKPGVNVFGSRIIREHVYNIIRNSFDQIRIRTKNRQQESGVIEIRMASEQFANLRGKERSYKFAKLSIVDNAGGIPTEHEARVLEPGYTTKRGSGGTGHGLTAAWEYMVNTGGYLELDNRPGEGLAVHMYFPVYTPGYHELLSKDLNIPPEEA